MEAAAAAKDYITAGKLQSSLQRLKKNKRVLQNLETRMFDAASKLDFVRAGRFQEQFQILLQHSESSNNSNALGKSGGDSTYGSTYGKSMPSSMPPLVAGTSAKNFSGLGSLPPAIAPMVFSSVPPSGLSASFPPPPMDDGLYDDGGYAFTDDPFGYYGDY